jgi:hypothetical protein
MKSKSRPGSAGEKSRRDFIQKIGTAAAASSVAASVSAAQQPPAPGRAPEPWVEAGPLSKQPMPTIRLGKHQVGRLILGVNGIGQHFSQVLARTYSEWNTPQQQVLRLKRCEELGINCMIQARDRIAKYNAENGGKMLFCNQGSYSRFPTGEVRDPTKTIKDMAALGSIAIQYSAAGADEIWRRGEFNKVREWCKIVRDTGALVGVNGHIPEAFMKMEDEGWDVDFYMTGLYIFGRTQAEWEKLYQSNPDLAPVAVGEPPTEGDSQFYGGQSVWVRGDPAKMLKVVKQVKKPCLVFKLLASGNLMANAQPKLQQQIVEARFKYVFENIKSTDAVVLAMWNKYEDQYALNKEYVIKYGGSSIKVS